MIGLRGYARLAATAIILISLKETLHPRQWTYSDLLYLIPIVGCAVIASFPTRTANYRTRLVAGFYIGLAFLFVINDDRNLAQDALANIAIRSLSCLIAGTAIFGTVTQYISSLMGGSKNESDCCQKCGYLLLGLVEPRCPECGTPFDPERVNEQALPADRKSVV